jgi:hypothetical protein
MSNITNSMSAIHHTLAEVLDPHNESQPDLGVELTGVSQKTQKIYRETFEGTSELERSLKVVPWNIIAHDFELEGDHNDWKMWSPHSSPNQPMFLSEEIKFLSEEINELDVEPSGLFNDIAPENDMVIWSPTPTTTTTAHAYFIPAGEFDLEPSGLYE